MQGIKWPEETRQAVLADVEKNGMAQTSASEKHGVPYATVHYWVAAASKKLPPSKQPKEGKESKRPKAKAKAEATGTGTRRTYTAEEEDRIVADFLGGMIHARIMEKYELSGSTATRLKRLAEERAKKQARADKRAGKVAEREREASAPKALTNGHANGHAKPDHREPLTASKEAELLYLRSENARLKMIVRAYTAELD